LCKLGENESPSAMGNDVQNYLRKSGTQKKNSASRHHRRDTATESKLELAHHTPRKESSFESRWARRGATPQQRRWRILLSHVRDFKSKRKRGGRVSGKSDGAILQPLKKKGKQLISPSRWNDRGSRSRSMAVMGGGGGQHAQET